MSLNGDPFKQPPDFTNKPEEFLAWAEENWDQSSGHFCPRHWIPAAVHGKNGIIGSMELMRRAVAAMPSNYTSPKARNRWMEDHSPYCCELGDEAIEQLWSTVPS
jgi:hypothetical protein